MKVQKMMNINIPIFITARGNTPEMYDFNKECLKFSYSYIKYLNLFSQTYIISDNKALLDYAQFLGFTNLIHHPCKSDKDIQYLEYLATYQYGINNNFYPDWIIILNNNQILKTYELLAKCITNIDDKYDVISSYTEIDDRSRFYVNQNNNGLKNYNPSKSEQDVKLLSSEKHIEKMVDTSIYAIKSSFAFDCMKHEDPSKYFWNGKIKYFKNNSIYTDIRSIHDIYEFYKINKVISEVQEIS